MVDGGCGWWLDICFGFEVIGEFFCIFVDDCKLVGLSLLFFVWEEFMIFVDVFEGLLLDRIVCLEEEFFWVVYEDVCMCFGFDIIVRVCIILYVL